MCGWIDVGTTAVPRLLTATCIGSFLEMCNRGGHKLRWIVHLDHYPNPGLDDLWDANREQIERLAERFDDSVLMFSDTNVGYGESVHRVMEQTRHRTLWIEDDYLWLTRFGLADLLKIPGDYVSLASNGFRTTYMGSTCPSIWSRKSIDVLLKCWPPKEEWKVISEMSVKRMIRDNRYSRRNPCGLIRGEGVDLHPINVGDEVLFRFGVAKVFPSRRIGENGFDRPINRRLD